MKPQITYDDFAKLDIRIGTVESVEIVEGADKLLKFVIDLGDERREIIASMRPYITDLEALIGKQLPILTNLEPRNFRGHTSHGMIIAADSNDRPVFIVPETEVPPGSTVR